MKEDTYEEKIKELEEEIAIMKERYRILAETTPALLFEYVPEEDKMIFLYNFPDNHKKREIEEYQKFAMNNPLIHPDHLRKFLDVLKKAGKSAMKGEIEYLSKVSNDEFEWHRTYYSSVEDENGKVISILGRIQNIHQSVTEKQKLQNRVETDVLTGLYNKNSAGERISKWLKSNPTGEAYLVMIDIDNFKLVNDRYGHTLGDEVLKETARLMRQCFGENNVLSRFGGDEFIALSTDEPLGYVESRVDAFMHKLCKEISVLEVLQQPISCSVGIAARASKYDEFDDLFNRADNAMYVAKKSGKNCYSIYKE